jgi:cobalt/nickel transport protein
MTRLVSAALLASCIALPAQAHFGMIIPSDTMVVQSEGHEIGLTYAFAHPFEAEGMVLEQPLSTTITLGKTTSDVAIDATRVMGAPGYTATVSLDRPGAHILGMIPQPFWEPAEDVFIQHFTKTYVAAYGSDEGWDQMLGYPVEIEPLSRPFGLWAGNMFQGVVTRDGAPVPFAEVEVEFFSPDGSVFAPDELMVTQTVKADGSGVFSYVTPWAGWWGFAALLEGPETIAFDGEEKGVEQGAVIWVHFEAPQ